MSRSFAHLIVAAAVTSLLVLACFQVPGDWNWKQARTSRLVTAAATMR